ncbi:MAG: hypothetical protein ACOH2A_01220 [Sphingobacteriaceae bacterium]
MKQKSSFSLIIIIVTSIFNFPIYAQHKSSNGDSLKLTMINKRAYFQYESKTDIILTDSVSKKLSFPREKIYQLYEAKAYKGINISEAIVKVLEKSKHETFPNMRIFVNGMVNESGKIIKLTIGVPEEYQISIEDCARIIEFVKKNVTLAVPKGKQGMVGSFTYGAPISFLKE